MWRDVPDDRFDGALARVDDHSLSFGDGRVHTPHFAHIHIAIIGDVVDDHGDFVGVTGEHEAR